MRSHKMDGSGVEAESNPEMPEFEEDLETFLQSDSDGKIILKAWSHNGGEFRRTERLKLSRIVIKRERDRIQKNYPPGSKLEKFELSTKRLRFLANEIARIFNGEQADAYFLRGKTFFLNGQKYRSQSSGMLKTHLDYTRTSLREKNMLEIKQYVRAEDYELNLNDDDKMKFDWLTCHLEPLDVINQYWRDTFEYRRKLLLVDGMEIHTYFDMMKCLKTEAGQKLLLDDFETLYPYKHNNLLNRWRVIKAVLLKELINKKIFISQDEVYKELLQMIPQDKQDAIILYLLPHLVDPYRVGKRKMKDTTTENVKPRNKLTAAEKRNHFILNIKNSSDIDIELDLQRINLGNEHESL